MGREFPPLTYTDQDAADLFLLEPAPRTIRGARNLLSVGIQYGNALGQGTVSYTHLTLPTSDLV